MSAASTNCYLNGVVPHQCVVVLGGGLVIKIIFIIETILVCYMCYAVAAVVVVGKHCA